MKEAKIEKKMTSRTVEVDEELAKELLTLVRLPEKGVKGTNRKYSPITVRNYAEAMLAGQWQHSHQGLAFSGSIRLGTAVLRDGEHRLRAVILANEIAARTGRPPVVVIMEVFENVHEDAVYAMDIGKRRGPGDFLTMQGEVDATRLAAIIKLAMLCLEVPYKADTWRSFKITPTQQKEFLEIYPEIRGAAREGSRVSKVMPVIPASVGWFLIQDSGHDPFKINEFYTNLADGTNLTKGNPIYTFREMMLKAKVTFRRFQTYEVLAMFLKSWNKWYLEEEMHLVAFRRDETSFPKVVKPKPED